MNQPIITLLIFGLLLIAVLSPFGALSALMLVVLGTGLLWTLWSLFLAFLRDPSEDSGSSGN
ncbi:hypothetical protein J0895_15270 [Phormidium pseudopriestleyi FRX01]|uniref:Uncharacterized protein n=1 Tax=Phormidium pseudopriestleyi FRX01 TaxID=1759528 RepID=A0ABS3FTH7_9CYAN|nr:hypothetical protein [Phormidium pseudopriestleyi]MBO0350431.1 hypothetical protein [Phormidium pseudopriestleyi FRX01]